MKQADEERELTRLLAQEPSPLTSSLDALREHGPDAAELASLASRLALHGLDVSVPQPQPRTNHWKKWAMGGAGSASAVLIWLGLRGAQPLPHALPVAESVASAVTAAQPPLPGEKVVERAASGVSRAPSATTAIGAPSESASLAVIRALPSSSSPEHSTGVAPDPAAVPVPGTDLRGTLAPSGAKAHAPAAPAAGATRTAPLSPGDVTAPSELELLRDARLALRQSPTRALQLTDEHARLYPRGKLTQERELIAVSALVGLGRRTAALSRAANFERLYPSSPYRKQMGDLLQ